MEIIQYCSNYIRMKYHRNGTNPILFQLIRRKSHKNGNYPILFHFIRKNCYMNGKNPILFQLYKNEVPQEWIESNIVPTNKKEVTQE